MSEGNSVVALRSRQEISNPGHPDPKVIEELERLLQLAKDGQIIGVAYAGTYYDLATTDRFVGRQGRSSVGSLFALASRISRAVDEAP